MTSEETIVAPSAPAGPAPRGVIRMSGPAATTILSRVFIPASAGSSGPRAAAFQRGRLVFDATGASCPAEIWRFSAPHSYTGEDVVECHVPGAPNLVALVLRRLVAAGARLAQPGEFTRRALLNGRMDLTRAEAVLALIRARDADEHEKARALLDGGLAREVASFEDRVIALLVPIELQLDFSDQDVVVLDEKNEIARIHALVRDLGALVARAAPVGRRLLPRVVIRGPANAGKSSLFNALAGTDVAITAPVRGTTRDVLSLEWTHGDTRALLVDTAGDDVHETALDELARLARERASREADLFLEVRDARSGGWPPPSDDSIRVGTMIDLDSSPPAAPADVVLVSNVTRAGLGDLVLRIASALAGSSAKRAEPFLVTARHAEAIDRARSALERAAAAIGQIPLELAASDLREALRALRGVRGAEDGDPVLDRIFREFCIGK